jgi:hypothetical protein
MTPRKSGLAIRDRVRIALVVGRAYETVERRADDASLMHRRTRRKPVDANNAIHPALTLTVVVLRNTARQCIHRPQAIADTEKSRWMKTASSTLRAT